MLYRILVLSSLCLIAIGCSKSSEEKAQEQAEAKVETTNQKIDRINDGIIDLNNQGVTLLADGKGCTIKSSFDSNKKTWAKDRLSTIESLSSEVLSVSNDPDVYLFGKDNIEDARDSARLCKAKLN